MLSRNSRRERPLSVEIRDGEEFSRFILNRKHFSAENKRVKANALLPMTNKATGRLETSTYRVAGLNDQEIWSLGYKNVENAANNRIIKARGQGPFGLVSASGLSCDVNGPPYPRHVDVIGWPQDKDGQLMKATEIADKLALEIDPRH
jgi:hypothetical protein